MRRALEFLLGDGLFISDGETRKQRRPLVNDIVHKNRVPAFGKIMENTTSELVQRWEALPEGAPVNALFEMAGLTTEIISRSVFGNDLGEDAASAVSEGFESYQSLIDPVNIGYFLGFDDGLPVLRTPKLRRSVSRIHQIIDKVVEDHLAGRGDNNSMIELLVRRQNRNPGAEARRGGAAQRGGDDLHGRPRDDGGDADLGLVPAVAGRMGGKIPA